MIKLIFFNILELKFFYKVNKYFKFVILFKIT